MIHELHEGKVKDERIVYFYDRETNLMVRGGAGNRIFVFIPKAWELSACVSS